MARLNWENVAAPDFSGSAQGIKDAAAMINQALAGARSGLSQYEGIQDDRVNKAFAMDLLKYQDPESYKAALDSGALFERPEANRLSSEMITAAGNRLPSLLNQAKTEFEFGRDKRADGQAVAFDAAAPLFAQVRTLMRNRDEAGANKLLASNPEISRGLSGRDVLALEAGNASALTDGWGLAKTKQGYKQDDWRFGNEVADVELRKSATAIAEDVYAHAGNAQEAQAYFDNLKLPPELKAAARGMLGLGAYPTVEVDPIDALLGGVGGGSGGSSALGGADPSRIMNYEARASGINSVPGNIKTLGQASDFALTVNKANKERTGKNGSSAMGLYQIVGTTMRSTAAQVFGPNWRNVDFTPQVQDQLARKIFEENRGSADALRKQWVSLTPGQAEQVRRMPWEQAREFIAKKESGAVNVAQLLLGQVKDTATRQVNQADQKAALNTGNNAKAFAATQADETPIATVVQKLQKSSFPGASPDVLLSRLREVQSRAQALGAPGLSDATAADILARSVKQRDIGNRLKDFGKTLVDPFALFTERGGLGGNTEVDYGAVDRMIKNNVPKANKDGSRTTTNQDIVGANALIDAQAVKAQQAAAIAQQAQADLNRARSQNANNGRQINLSPLILRAERARAVAQQFATVLDEAPVANTPPPVDWGSASKFQRTPPKVQRPQTKPQPGWSLIR